MLIKRKTRIPLKKLCKKVLYSMVKFLFNIEKLISEVAIFTVFGVHLISPCFAFLFFPAVSIIPYYKVKNLQFYCTCACKNSWQAIKT